MSIIYIYNIYIHIYTYIYIYTSATVPLGTLGVSDPLSVRSGNLIMVLLILGSLILRLWRQSGDVARCKTMVCDVAADVDMPSRNIADA